MQAKELLGRRELQSAVTSLTLVENRGPLAGCPRCGLKKSAAGTQLCIVRPRDFREIVFEVESVPNDGRINGGERVTIYSDDVRLTVMSHAAQAAARITLTKLGRRRFDPNTDR